MNVSVAVIDFTRKVFGSRATARWLAFGAGAFLAVTLAGGCKNPKPTPAAKTPGTGGYKAPPVPYVVGKMETADDAAEPSVKLNVAVDPATSTRDLERLLNYFDKERYAHYDLVWVNVYFDVAKARSPDVNADALVASLRVNRPAFRELKVSDELGAPEGLGDQPEVTTPTEEVLYLGNRGRMFDSTRQAQALLDLMEGKPGHALYRVVWKGPGDMELSYSVAQKMLVRVRTGVSRETWAGMTVDGVKRAARGAGFGGKGRHGGDYSYILETGKEGPPEEG
jgi:hypothetical protein